MFELQEKKKTQEKACAANASTNSPVEPAHGPHTSHANRAPQSEKLEMAHGGSTRTDSSDTNRGPAQTEQPTLELKPFLANLRFLEDLKALQMVIWGILMKAQQTVIGDLIEKLTSTKQIGRAHV